jgi:hypothetical protein
LVSHWLQFETDEPFVPNLKKFGFVYLIINTQNGKGYVGCKQYYIGKAKKESKWQTYMGSSKYLKEDIKKIGKKHFRFEVIAEYINKRSLRYYEAHYQMKWDVLTAVIEGTDEPAFYNSYVGGKFYRPVESYTPLTEETKRKISETKVGVPNILTQGEKNSKYQGKAEFYLDDKRMVVYCLGAWCNKNGYIRSSVMKIAQTIRDGFYINKGKGKNDTARAFSCKGPLGTITKVRWLGKEETNGN